MILLSALLASLTGLVSGERPVERAQVELSAVAAVVQAGTTATQASIRPESQQPRLERRSSGVASLVEQMPVRSVRTLLRLKQSWLQ
jgi:hypothetical protein